MNQIITIGREFGSGGRELGKRLSDLLGFAYYDKEIITEIAKRTQLAEGYVRQIVEQKSGVFYPITVSRTLHGSVGNDYMLHQYTKVYAEKAKVLRDMADKSDCIIVGRCADYILRDLHPLRIFVYADMDFKLKRCREKGEEHDEHDDLTDKQLRKNILSVDKNRAKYYGYYTGQKWGDRSNYDVCINTSAISVKECAEALAMTFRSRNV